MAQTGRKDQRKVAVSSPVSLSLGLKPKGRRSDGGGRREGRKEGREEEEEAEGPLILKITATTFFSIGASNFPEFLSFENMKVDKTNSKTPKYHFQNK